MIRRNIELEARLIDDLLDLSRFSRGQMRLDFETIDIHEAIQRAIEICSDETFISGLEVVTDLAAAQHHVNADHARLMQVFWNLIRNAVKFTPPNGRLTIRSTNASIDPRCGQVVNRRLIAVEFQDTGVGIDSRCCRESSRRSSSATTICAAGPAVWAWVWRSAGRSPRHSAGGSWHRAPAAGLAQPSASSWPRYPPRGRRGSRRCRARVA